MNDIMEAFAALAVSCGIIAYTSDHQGRTQQPDGRVDGTGRPRTVLLESLRDFTQLIIQNRGQANNTNESRSNSNNDSNETRLFYVNSPTEDLLLKMETHATQLRKACHEFLTTQKELLADASDLVNEIGVLCGTQKEYQDLVLQSRSLWVAFRKVLFLERTKIDTVLDSLGNLHQPDKEHNLLEVCLDLETFLKISLQQQQHPVSREFQGFLSTIEAWQDSPSDSEVAPDANNKNSSMIPTTIVPPMNRSFDSESETKRFSIESIPCLESFQFSPRHEHTSVIHKVLLVGRESAGKTHICNAIEDFGRKEHVRGRLSEEKRRPKLW